MNISYLFIIYIFFWSKLDFRLTTKLYNWNFLSLFFYIYYFLTLMSSSVLIYSFNLLEYILNILRKIFFLPSILPDFFQVLKYFNSYFSESLPEYINLCWKLFPLRTLKALPHFHPWCLVNDGLIICHLYVILGSLIFVFLIFHNSV